MLITVVAIRYSKQQRFYADEQQQLQRVLLNVFEL